MLGSMRKSVDSLKEDGFAVTGRNEQVVFMSRHADHRVVFQCGMVKRGQPKHRRK